jgi:hypothetical protein
MRRVRRSRRTALLIRLTPVVVATLVAIPVLVSSSGGGPVPLAVVSPNPVRLVPAPRAVANSQALAFSIPRTLQVAPVARGVANPNGFVEAALTNARTELDARARVDAEVKAEAATSVPKPTVTAKPKSTTSKPQTPAPAPRTTKPVTKPKVTPVTTVPIPVTPAPPAVALGGPYSPDDVIAIIRSIFPADVADKAIAVARRESSLNPNAQNWCCTGLFQIYAKANAATIAALGYTSSQLTDPTVNTIVAYALYQRSGWAPWGF